MNSIQNRLKTLEQESYVRVQWNRRNNDEIKGIPQINLENLFEIVGKIGSKKIDLGFWQWVVNSLPKTQINFITRVPTREKNKCKSRIPSFCNRYAKEGFITVFRITNKTISLTSAHIGISSNQKIFINGQLTSQNKLLLSRTNKAARN